MTLDLIEQVAVLRGQIGSLEIEWKNVKDIVQKSYQRMEKANQRAERRIDDDDGASDPPAEAEAQESSLVPLVGFAKKLAEMKKGA